MNDTPDADGAATGGGSGFDPREAAWLLEQAGREARRKFSLHPPLVMAVGAGVILLAYGALWATTRGQQPYSGPSLGVIALVYAVVAVSIAVAAKVYQRATALPEGDALWVTRLQHMLRLTPGHLITHLRELEDAGYLACATTGNGEAQATVAALCEHFAHTRLTLGELNTRLGAALAATTHGQLSRATRDLPEATVVSAGVSFRGKRRRPGYPPGPVAGQAALPRRRRRIRGGSP